MISISLLAALSGMVMGSWALMYSSDWGLMGSGVLSGVVGGVEGVVSSVELEEMRLSVDEEVRTWNLLDILFLVAKVSQLLYLVSTCSWNNIVSLSREHGLLKPVPKCCCSLGIPST